MAMPRTAPLIYRGHDIIENASATSYLVYGDNDILIKEFSKNEVSLDDVYDYIDKRRREGK